MELFLVAICVRLLNGFSFDIKYQGHYDPEKGYWKKTILHENLYDWIKQQCVLLSYFFNDCKEKCL